MTIPTMMPRAGFVLASALLAGACSDALLDVDHPDVIDPSSLENALGALTLYAGAINDFSVAHDGGSGSFGSSGVLATSGLFTDEYRYGGTRRDMRELDLQDVAKENFEMRSTYLPLHRARVAAERAADAIAQRISASDARIGELQALSAAVHIVVGEHFCSGAPFTTTVAGEIHWGVPLSTVEIMQLALDRLETASGTTGGDARIENLIAVLRGRAYVNMGRFSDAASAVSGVPTDFEYRIVHSDDERSQNTMAFLIFEFDELSVSDQEGGAGLNFASANDPRVVVDNPGVSRNDGETPHFRLLKYDDYSAPVTLASGVEARLIEAEAALQNNDVTGWLNGLNAARAFFGVEPTTDPGTQRGREDLMFRERAFSLFSTNHRLGDMRRLVQHYGRPRNEVFPNGLYHKGNLMRGVQMSFIIPADEENNPNFQRSACDPNAP